MKNKIMCKKQKWVELAEQCDIARNKYYQVRDSGHCVDQAWQDYQDARKAEHDAYFDYLAD